MAVAVADYPVVMKKYRVPLELDEDLVEALHEVAAARGDISSVANEVLREVLESEMHRRALTSWMEEIYQRFGRPTPEQYAQAEAIIAEALGLPGNGTDAE